MSHRDGMTTEITTTSVDGRCKVARMSSTRALSKTQSAHVRERLREIKTEAGSQEAAARRLGISQQVLGRILNGDPAGLYVATKLARFEHVPLEVILDGAPESLTRVLRRRAGRWSDPAIAAVCKHAALSNAAQSEEHWDRLLDTVHHALAHLVEGGRTKLR